MNLQYEIDPESGFCYGVIRAVQTAEENLKSNSTLFSLGSIVHNSLELQRLRAKGLTVVDIGKMRQLHNATVLIRAHGEPPQTYSIAKENNITLIDCTCPVVLKLQALIRNTYASLAGGKGTLLIFGKRGHAEVNGLVGQVNGNAVVVEDIASANEALAEIDLSLPIHIFSQTTKDPNEFEELCNHIGAMQRPYGIRPVIHNTICRRVANRHSKLRSFALSHSPILFVSGRESSNGKVLFDLCSSINPRTYFIEDESAIERDWFKEGDFVGICGATSTPKWQLERVASHLESL